MYNPGTRRVARALDDWDDFPVLLGGAVHHRDALVPAPGHGAQRHGGEVRAALHRALVREPHEGVAVGENRGHVAERVDRVSHTGANFAFLLGSRGTCARYAADGRLKQNTSPSLRDVLSKLSMLDRHTGHTNASESISSGALGAQTGPAAATPCWASPATLVTRPSAMSRTKTAGSTRPTSCSPHSSLHRPLPLHPFFFFRRGHASSRRFRFSLRRPASSSRRVGRDRAGPCAATRPRRRAGTRTTRARSSSSSPGSPADIPDDGDSGGPLRGGIRRRGLRDVRDAAFRGAPADAPERPVDAHGAVRFVGDEYLARERAALPDLDARHVFGAAIAVVLAAPDDHALVSRRGHARCENASFLGAERRVVQGRGRALAAVLVKSTSTVPRVQAIHHLDVHRRDRSSAPVGDEVALRRGDAQGEPGGIARVPVQRRARGEGQGRERLEQRGLGLDDGVVVAGFPRGHRGRSMLSHSTTIGDRTPRGGDAGGAGGAREAILEATRTRERRIDAYGGGGGGGGGCHRTRLPAVVRED